VRYGAGTWPGVRTIKLFEESFFPVCSPGYRVSADAPFTTPADLRRHRLIHVLGEREDWSNYFQRLKLEAPLAAEGLQFDSLFIATQGCIAGGGVMLATSPLVDGLVTEGKLIDLFGERIPARYAHYLVLPESAESAADMATVLRFLTPD